MNKNGFFIKKLELVGTTVESVSIEFKQGLNVVYGASDTGKTFIFQCINFMLGGNGLPKPIPEAENYNFCRLEIETYKGENYSLERSLKGGDFNLVDSFKKSRELKVSNQSSNETISDFLLNICNMSGKKIRKNARGVTQNLYFQNLKKFFAIDEVRIVTEDSILTSGQYLEKTFDKNTLKYLITSIDDNSVIATLDNNIEYKKGKVALYNELISQLSEDLKDTEYDKIDEQIERLDDGIKNYQEIYLQSKTKLNKYDQEKDNLVKEIFSQESILINKLELLKRSQLLKKQYISDISRLKATLEAGQHLESAEKSNCPICDSDIEEVINIPELTIATNAEISKIELLLNELEASQKIYTIEKEDIENKFIANKKHLEEVIIKIQTELKDFLDDISKNIKSFSDKKQELSRIKTLKEKLEDYTNKRDSINISDKKAKNTEQLFEDLTTALMTPIVEEIEYILKNINFDNPKNPKIAFSDKLLDFVVNTKNRKEYGKGYRAILYASFVIALLQFFRNKSFQIGLVLLDSPLNPYKSDEKKDGGEVPNNLADNFYRYIHDNIKDEQVILIENTSISEDLKKSVNHYEFTREKGFLPSIRNSK
ncbi:MAG: hypothetical protein WC279_00115 [Sulfurimonas sp.]|jgi:hypothetical protein|uniref:hypothetical protein n=1 Tax=Sulfurimonas sp. TaxID=2022749 RepID=UPI00356A76C0